MLYFRLQCLILLSQLSLHTGNRYIYNTSHITTHELLTECRVWNSKLLGNHMGPKLWEWPILYSQVLQQINSLPPFLKWDTNTVQRKGTSHDWPLRRVRRGDGRGWPFRLGRGTGPRTVGQSSPSLPAPDDQIPCLAAPGTWPSSVKDKGQGYMKVT